MEKNKIEFMKPPYVMTAQEVLDLNIQEIPMLLHPYLQKEGIASLCGSSDTGKSYLCLWIALAICSDDESLWGLKLVKENSSVIIICTEDAAEDICVRLTKLANGKKINKENLRFIFETDNLISKLKGELKREPADLVIIDTLGDLFSGNLNDSIDVRKFLNPYKRLAKTYKCLFLFNHHIGKGKEKNLAPSKNDVLGSQGIEAACRTVLMLGKRDDGKRVLTVIKGNYIPEDLKNKGMVLDFDTVTGFQPTGKTISFSAEACSDETGNNEIPELDEQVKTLYPVLKSYKKVATALKEKGYKKVDKNKVGQIWRKYYPSTDSPK